MVVVETNYQSNDIIGKKTVYGNAYWVKYQPLLCRVLFTIQSFDMKNISGIISGVEYFKSNTSYTNSYTSGY